MYRNISRLILVSNEMLFKDIERFFHKNDEYHFVRNVILTILYSAKANIGIWKICWSE